MTAVAAAKPLAGRLVVVTRPRAQAQAFAALLESAGARVLTGNVVTTKPIIKNAPTLRNAQGHRITARSLGKTPGQKLCQRSASGGYTCARVS